jgi:hypothetical protein
MTRVKSPNTDEVVKPRIISIECRWASIHDIEVPDNWTEGDGIPIERLRDVDSRSAYLLDWKVV